MCVRCGTGRIAWCTNPDRHEPSTPEAKLLALVRELAGNYHEGLLSAESAMDAIVAVLL